MDKLSIEIVNSKEQMKEFLALPGKIYRDDPQWIKPLPILEKGEYNPRKNPVLRRSEHLFLLAREGENAVARMIIYIDPRYNDFHKSRTGFFGSFESYNNSKAADLLFREADDWFAHKGMTDILGPINPVAESWGLVLEGSAPPVFLSPHNPFYYNDLLTSSGLKKAKDLLVYEADGKSGYILPERYTRFSETLLQRKPEITVRRIRRFRLKEEALHILRILNDSVAGNWGFVPVLEDEMTSVVKQLKPILDRDAIWFVEEDGYPVGVALGFPDINVLLKEMKGHVTPSTLFRFLKGRKTITDYRLWGLAVMPEYHGLGLDVLLYVSLFRSLEPRGIRLEANYMLEDNPKILNALEKMNLKLIKKYRVYGKDI